MPKITPTPSIITLLPSEIKHEILQFTTWTCVLGLRLTCRTWNSVITSHLFASSNPDFRLASSHWYRVPDSAVTIYHKENAENILAGKLKKSLQVHVADSRAFNLPVSPGHRNDGYLLDRRVWLKNRKKQSTEMVTELDINYVKSKWKPPLRNDTKIHRLVGWLCVPNTGEFEIQLRPDIAAIPGLIDPSISKPAALLDLHRVESEEGTSADRPFHEETGEAAEKENEEDEEEEETSSLPKRFLSDSLFQPPMYTPIPVRIRWYHATHSPECPACGTSRSYEAIKFFVSPYIEVNPSLYQNLQPNRPKYITISDIVLALTEQLANFMGWGYLYTITRFNFHVNASGWLDITLMVDDYETTISDHPETDNMSEYASDVYEYVTDDEEIITDSADRVMIKGKSKSTDEGDAEDVDEEFEGLRFDLLNNKTGSEESDEDSEDDYDYEYGDDSEEEVSQRNPVHFEGIDEGDYKEKIWYTVDHIGYSLTAYEDSRVYGMPKVARIDEWTV